MDECVRISACKVTAYCALVCMGVTIIAGL